MLERLLFLAISSIIASAVYALLRLRRRKARRYMIVARGERDANIYYKLIRSKLFYPAYLGARTPGYIGLFLVFLSLAFLSLIAYRASVTDEAQLQLVIPGVTITSIYGIIGILAAIPIAVIMHESSHAFAGILKSYEPKSTGVVALGPFIIAYVSFDDEENIDAQIASAGFVTNFLLGLLFLLTLRLVSYILAPYSSGVLITSGPKEIVGKVVVAIDGHAVRNVAEFLSVRQNIPKGSEVTLVFSDGSSYTIIKGSIRLGISNRYFSGVLAMIVATLLAILFRSFVINISLAIINALPIIGLDGSKVVYHYVKEKPYARILLLVLTSYSIATIFVALAP